MTALETLRAELARVQAAQVECLTEWGAVKQECRYRYQILCRKGQELMGSVEFLQDIYKEGGEVGAKS